MPKILPCKKCSKLIASRKNLSGFCWNCSPFRKRKIIHFCEICGSNDRISLRYGVHCLRHWRQMRKYGKICCSGSQENEIEEQNGYILISLYTKRWEKRKEKAIIDKSDWEEVKKYRWCLDSNGYATSKHGRLHNLILGIKGVDHINHNRLDNRKENLRKATQSQNTKNRITSTNFPSGRIGVSKTPSEKWRAYIKSNRKQIFLGNFSNLSDAIKAREEGELKYFKDFAPKKG